MAASTPVHWPPLVVLNMATVDAEDDDADDADDADDLSELICKLCTLCARCVDCLPCVAVRCLNFNHITLLFELNYFELNYFEYNSIFDYLRGVGTDAGFTGGDPLRWGRRLLR